MARAKTLMWLNVVAGLIVGAAAQPLTLTAAPGPDPTAPGTPAAQPAPTAAHALLSSAIDCQRHGDFDAAARLLVQVEARQAELTLPERQDLAGLRQSNALALRMRREGAEYLRQATKAFAEGRGAEAAALLRRAAANDQYLTGIDKQRYLQLTQQLKVLPARVGSGVTPTVNPSILAHMKIRQARAQFTEGNFDAAERLAREVQQSGASFTPNEDNPRRLLEDVGKARQDPKALLHAARNALAHKDLVQAEMYAKLADKGSSFFTFPVWGDSPSKVLKEVEEARKADRSQAARTQAATPPGRAVAAARPGQPAGRPSGNDRGTPPAPKDMATPDSLRRAPSDLEAETRKARALLKQGREAMNKGDFTLARKCADQARVFHANLQWYDDNPDKLQADIALHSAARKDAEAHRAPDGTRNTKEDAVFLLERGRAQLAQNKLDDAAKTAHRARAMTAARWGLFEDNPDSLLRDVEKARARRNQEESVRMLGEARRLLAAHEFDRARVLACKAQTLHGPYSIWDMSDQPKHVLADIAQEQDKLRRNPPPARQPTALAQGKVSGPGLFAGARPGPRPGVTPVAAVQPAARPDPNAPRARQLLSEARAALRNNDLAKARMLAGEAAALHAVLNQPGDDSPEKVFRDLDAMVRVRPPNPVAMRSAELAQGAGSRPVAMPSSEALAANKARARQLLAEAYQLEREQRLLEARQKVVAAQKVGALFSSNEDNPNLAYQRLVLHAQRRIDGLVNRADNTISFGQDEPTARYARAEQDLVQARDLAAGFGHDTHAIDLHIQQVQRLRGVGSAPAATQVARRTDPGPGFNGMTPAAGQANPLMRGNEADPRVVYNPAGPGPTPVRPAAYAPRTPAAPAANPQGRALLESARVELRKGELTTARRLVEDAIQGPYGVQNEAMALLRSIDAEELRQRHLQSRRTFDAAVSAFNRREYARANMLLASVNLSLLDPGRRTKLNEIRQTPEMSLSQSQSPAGAGQPAGGALVQAGARQAEPARGAPAVGTTPGGGQPPAGGEGRAHVSDDPNSSLLAQTQALREIEFQRLRDQGMRAQREAADKFRTGQMDAALDILTDYLAQLENQSSRLQPGQLTLLKRPVESRLKNFELLRDQKRLMDNATVQSRASLAAIDRDRLRQANKEKNMSELMKQFNSLYRDGKYVEAEAVAMRAKDLDPDNGVATAAAVMAKMAKNRKDAKDLKQQHEDGVLEILTRTDDEGPMAEVFQKDGIHIDPKRAAISRQRKGESMFITGPRKNTREREIEQKLTEPVHMNFKDAPLSQILADIRNYHDINIDVDEPALRDKNISMNDPITESLDGISLKSALNLILHKVHLTYVIENEVLQVTTEENARGKMQTVTYNIADLIIPVPDFGDVQAPPPLNPPDPENQVPPTAVTPYTGPSSMPGGTPIGTMTSASARGGSQFASASPGATSTITRERATRTAEEQLIKLITNTIAPTRWSEMGGQGSIDYYPLTMALVVNQTQDIQEQIADLLAALRRLQDQEVAIEVRFISIAEDFFERIGVNFNMNIVHNNTRFQPEIISGQFALPGYINGFYPQRFLAGLTPTNTITPDLNIPINVSTYTQALPPFGGYPGIAGFGGIQTGLAFLSDIQVFLFLEAVQGDRRTNVMQAPKLTLFNGQTATLNVFDQQWFVTNVRVLPPSATGGQYIYSVQNQPFRIGVNLTLQAVISADRRFVRVNLAPTLTNLASFNINIFPVVTPIFPLFDGTATGQPVVFTQFLQQPIINSVNVLTTVAVPDGGTVLMGGLKRLSEGRNEYGPPILSKIPYIDRLFRNVGYGRETESLMLMVTPRIIIQEEEEERQTGVVRPPAVPQP